MAAWTASYINDLPDGSFAYIAPGGKKDSEGKTVPRSLRFLPYKDAAGNLDADHIRNGLARVSQADIPAAAQASAKAKLTAALQRVNAQNSSVNAAIRSRAR